MNTSSWIGYLVAIIFTLLTIHFLLSIIIKNKIKRNKIMKYIILFILYSIPFYIAEYFDAWSKIKHYFFSK
jgi:hypothetical protein